MPLWSKEAQPIPGSVHPGRAIDAIIRNQDDFVVRLYSRIRFSILRQRFLEEIGQYLPEQGEILDLGAGFGLFSLYFAITGPGRSLTGVELNEKRVQWARDCAARLGIENVRYEVDDVREWECDRAFDAVYMLDLIHHLPSGEVSGFLEKVKSLLRPGGILVLKDVSDRPHYKRLFTWALDRLMVGWEPIRYWPPAELAALLEGLGFDVKRHAMNDYLPYPHMLYLCRLGS